MGPEYRQRLRRLRSGISEAGCGALLVTGIHNVRYLTGFTGSSGFAVITPDEAFFITDSRYATQSKDEVAGLFKVRIYARKWLDEASAVIGRVKPGVVGFEGANLSYEAFVKVKKSFGGVRLKSVPDPVGRVRMVKDPFEVSRIRASAAILDHGYKAAKRLLRPGAVEKEVAASVESAFKKRGADGVAFDTIIASGPRGALPHGKASDKRIKSGELVVVDMGVALAGYNSDETRTFCTGKATAFQKEIYKVVKEAQQRAIESVRPGVAAVEVDRAARECIKKAGYGKYFGHSTGHGVGLDVHEGPSVGPMSKDILEDGMVITIEPGIYVPGRSGVRIEDMALVTKNGYEILTKTDKELVCLQ